MFIYLLQAFSNGIFHTVVQQLPRFRLTARRAVFLRYLGFLSLEAVMRCFSDCVFIQFIPDDNISFVKKICGKSVCGCFLCSFKEYLVLSYDTYHYSKVQKFMNTDGVKLLVIYRLHSDLLWLLPKARPHTDFVSHSLCSIFRIAEMFSLHFLPLLTLNFFRTLDCLIHVCSAIWHASRENFLRPSNYITLD